MPLGLLPAEVDLPGNRKTHEKPVAETVVVDELENVLDRQIDQGHEALNGRDIHRKRVQHEVSSQTGASERVLTLKMSAGIGVNLWMWIIDRASGR